MSEIDDIFNKPKSSKKRPAPDTVLDSSQKKQKVDSKKPKLVPKKNNPRAEIQQFKDSRGTGPRRKTEEGWSIYKEDELGINDEGGGTALLATLVLSLILKIPRYARSTVNAVSRTAKQQVFSLPHHSRFLTCCNATF
ncbi:hypothetical protein C8F01DRAFT_1109573 [Mycena amicta]|nr:hypothetical protein C8F01DRAFT_1109573 [Mycena amicta]